MHPSDVSDPLARVPGRTLGPPPKDTPKVVARLERDRPWARVAWDAFDRFRSANTTVMAGGTAYYGFVAMFSLLALVYGIAALVDAGRLASWMTRSLEQALPGLVGDQGIDPDTLSRIGRASSIVGLVLLAWSGSAVMVATSRSLRQIYGAPADGRNPLAQRARLLGWLAVIGPLIMASYTLTTYAADLGPAILAAATAATFVLDVGITFLLLGHLGGIRPPTRPLVEASVVGALLIGVLKGLMSAIVSWSIDKPQYGSFTVPVAVLVVLWLQALVLYGSACVCASLARWRAGQDPAPS